MSKTPLPHPTTEQLLKEAERLAKRGNIRAMNALHLYDLKKAGHKAQNLNVPSEYGRRISTVADVLSLCSSSASW